jgi:hypothetical protein
MLAALLFPDNISEYAGYEDFFIRRRRWFFSLLAATFALDVTDTLIKGTERWNQLSSAYLLQVPIGLALCLVGFLVARRSVQIAVAALHLSMQLLWILQAF